MKNPIKKHSFRKKALSLALASALMMGLPVAAQAALITGGAVNALMVTETISGNSVQTTATTGPLSNEGGDVGQSMTGATLNNASALGVVPANNALSTTVYQNNTDAEAAVTSYLNGGSPSILSQIASAVAGNMKSSGGAEGGDQLGMFTLIQNMQIANPTGGAPTKVQAYSTVIVQPDGNYQFLGTNVNNNNIFLLYADYQQSKDANYLPAGWTVPGAGDLTWELLEVNEEGNTITGSVIPVNGQTTHVINDNGAYDATVITGPKGKPEAQYATAVQKLITNQITPLMKQYNASMGIVLYGEQVKAARNSAGQPLLAISVNQRTLTQQSGSCTSNSGPGVFSDSGEYGYLLNNVYNEYIVQSDGSYSIASQITKNSLSPKATFSSSYNNIPANSSSSSYEQSVLLPSSINDGLNLPINFTSGNPIPVSDYTYISPLNVLRSGSSGSYIKVNSNGNSYCGDFSNLSAYTNYHGIYFYAPTIYENGMIVPSGNFVSGAERLGVRPVMAVLNSYDMPVIAVTQDAQIIPWQGSYSGPAFALYVGATGFTDPSDYDYNGIVCTPYGCQPVSLIPLLLRLSGWG